MAWQGVVDSSPSKQRYLMDAECNQILTEN